MSERVLVEANKFTVYFKPTVHRKQTMRDVFVSFFKARLFNPSKDKYIVLNNLSLKVYRGDVLGLIGVNGVGKTTLCRYFAGIIKSSEIKIHGEVRAIFDNSICFYPNLTGRENAEILAEIMFPGTAAEEKEKLVNEALAFSELNEFVDAPINTYSRGMRARLYLSLVTAREADVLVLDEIFGGTDQFFARKIEERIKSIVQKSGAVIMVSHDPDDIQKFCNRAIVLDDKKIVFDGSPSEALSFYNGMKGD